jgi:hypothetical protein
MVAVQRGMTETLIDQHIQNFIHSDGKLVAQYKRVRNFRETLDFFQTQIELKMEEPLRSNAEVFVGRIRNLASQRHHIMHRLWAAECHRIPGIIPEMPIRTPTPHFFVSRTTSRRKRNRKMAAPTSTGN